MNIEQDVLSGVRVLIADDEPLMQDLLVSALKSFGAREFETAANGAEAVRKFMLGGHTMVFLDIDMPEKDGLQCLTEIREFDSNVFVSMVTGHSSADNVITAQQAGVNGFLVKPYSKSKVDQLVQNYLCHIRKS